MVEFVGALWLSAHEVKLDCRMDIDVAGMSRLTFMMTS